MDKKLEAGISAAVLFGLNFFLSFCNLTTGIMWFVTAFIGVVAVIQISQLVNENKILQYLGRISLIVLCIHGPVYRIVVKIVSISLHMGTDVVRENFLQLLFRGTRWNGFSNWVPTTYEMSSSKWVHYANDECDSFTE